MPVILGVIVLFIYISMYAHDRCAICYVCFEACARSVYEEDCENAAKEFITDELGNRLILEWETKIKTYSDETGVYAEVKARTGYFDRTCDHEAMAYKHFYPKY